METIEQMRSRAGSMPYGEERVALRRQIWRLRKAQLADESRERRRPSPDGLVIRTSSPVARKDYECYGCGGECPIPRGDAYFAAKVINGGRIVMVRYCQRCHAAIESKLANSRDGTLKVDGPGQFRWTRLSNAFRKRWTRLIEELERHEGDREAQRKAIVEFGNENRGH